MSKTLLVHGRCGHPVVIDATKMLRVVSPSWTISMTGISNIMLDIAIDADSKPFPAFTCIKCHEGLSLDELRNEVKSECQVCGDSYPVSELHCHSAIAVVCESCITAMRGDGKLTSRQERYKGAFSIVKTTRTVPMIKVLTMPIKLGK